MPVNLNQILRMEQ